MTTPIRRSPVHTGEVVATERITPRLQRVTVRAEAMRDLELRPAQDVELHLQEPSGRRVKRRYTVRHHRAGIGEIDLDVVLHGDGPGAEWGRTAAPGDTIGFQGPRGKLQLRDADWHLLAGDESALPAIASICESLAAPAIAFVETADADEQQTIGASTTWLHRDDRAPGTPELLLAALETFSLPAGRGHAYLMGETRSMVALRAVLESRGVEHDAIFVKGYWNLPRTGARPTSINSTS